MSTKSFRQHLIDTNSFDSLITDYPSMDSTSESQDMTASMEHAAEVLDAGMKELERCFTVATDLLLRHPDLYYQYISLNPDSYAEYVDSLGDITREQALKWVVDELPNLRAESQLPELAQPSFTDFSSTIQGAIITDIIDQNVFNADGQCNFWFNASLYVLEQLEKREGRELTLLDVLLENVQSIIREALSSSADREGIAEAIQDSADYAPDISQTDANRVAQKITEVNYEEQKAYIARLKSSFPEFAEDIDNAVRIAVAEFSPEQFSETREPQTNPWGHVPEAK